MAFVADPRVNIIGVAAVLVGCHSTSAGSTAAASSGPAATAALASAPASGAASSAVSAAPSASPSTTSSAPPPVDGRLPFPGGPMSPTADFAVGARVLAPPRPWIDQARRHGVETQSFQFFLVEVTEVGRAASRVRTRSGATPWVENGLVVPLGAEGSRAEAGTIVLTAWASGAGLQRAVVVEGGETPKVRYLDLPEDHPSGWGRRADRLPKGTFRAVQAAGDPGASVACPAAGGRHRPWIRLRAVGEAQLLWRPTGALRLDDGTCRALPPTPETPKNATVWAPVEGTYREVRVRGVEAGRVEVRFKRGGKKREATVALPDVALEL